MLVTAGPTREPIDAVRYLSNRSSGRMGVAIAATGAARGWATTLLLGPVDAAIEEGIRKTWPAPPQVHRFETTEELRTVLRRHWPAHDVLVMAAAVADHRPHIDDPAKLATKHRRADGDLLLRLEPTPDLLAELAGSARDDQVTIGFALEPRDRLSASASEKLRRKRITAIVANPLETMDAPTIEGELMTADGRVMRPAETSDPTRSTPLDKAAFARWLLDRIEALWLAAGDRSIRSGR